MKRLAQAIGLSGTICFAIAIVSGCATRTVYLEGRRAFPAKPRFTIMPREYTQEELRVAGIRTDGVYVRVGHRPEELRVAQEQTFREKGWRTGSPFLRFWPNGRVMGRLPSVDFLTVGDVDSFEKAGIGYFEITTNGVVEIERYLYHSGIWDHTYRRSRFYVEGDTIWRDLGSMHNGEPIQLGYRFVPIKGMRSQPDW